MSNNLKQAKKDLKAFAKRAKNVKYTESLLFSYLITGMITFSIGLNTSSNVLYERMNKELVMSADKTRTVIKKKKKAYEEAIEDLNLELIQLMEQGDQVVKSKWDSWQFGANTFVSSSNGTYKGRGDKAEKYSFEGIFSRGDWASTGILSNRRRGSESTALNSSTVGSRAYGLASLLHVQEPEVEIQIMANVRPKSVTKEEISINPQIDMPREVVRPEINLSVTSPITAPTILLPTLNPVTIEVPNPQEPATPPTVTAPSNSMNLSAPTIGVSVEPPKLEMRIEAPSPSVSPLTITAPSVSEVSAITVTPPSPVTLNPVVLTSVVAPELSISTGLLSQESTWNFHGRPFNTAGLKDRNTATNTISISDKTKFISTWGNVTNLGNVNLNVDVNVDDTRAFMIDEGRTIKTLGYQEFNYTGTINLNKSKNVGLDLQGTHTVYDISTAQNSDPIYLTMGGIANVKITNSGKIYGNGDGTGTIKNQVAFGFNNYDKSSNNTRTEMYNSGTIIMNSKESAGIQIRPENSAYNTDSKRGLNMMAGINDNSITMNGASSFGIFKYGKPRCTNPFHVYI